MQQYYRMALRLVILLLIEMLVLSACGGSNLVQPTETQPPTAKPKIVETIVTVPVAALPTGKQVPVAQAKAVSAELPADAVILYEDDFKDSSGGWPQQKVDNYIIGYSEGEYYRVQILKPNFKYPVYVPTQVKFEDMNVEVGVETGAVSGGDFYYGLIFRRADDEFYAFAISSHTKKWYVLKSSAAGLKIRDTGASDDIQDLKNVLMVTTQGSLFFLRINGQLTYEFNDPDYQNGEVGLFVQTVDSSGPVISFDSIIIWSQAPQEACSNNKDDDGNGLVDKADPQCLPPTLIPFTPTAKAKPLAEITAIASATACTKAPDLQCGLSNPYNELTCECGAFVEGGCLDVYASNYDSSAPYDDGSCEYNPTEPPTYP